MKNGIPRRNLVMRPKYVLIGVFIMVTMVVALPVYSVRSSLTTRSLQASQASSLAASNPTIRAPWAAFQPLLPVPQDPGTIATFDATCTLPKTTFVLGDTVCAKAFGATGLRFAWVDSAGFVRQRTDITTDPQNETFTLPSTQQSIVNDTTVDNRGEWRVNIITSRGSAKASAFFTVKDPDNAATDLSIVKTVLGDSAVENGPVQFSVLIVNHGPDDAVNVHFVDNQFTNATLDSVTQTEGPPFICNPGPNADCSLALMPKGAEARFLLNFTAGVAGGNLQNTASVTSDTAELNPTDNDNTAATIRVASGGAPPACVLECPANINANADTEENNQRGTHVSYAAPTEAGTCGTVTTSPASGSFFPVGTTVVTATSTQGGGSCSFTVTVFDEGAPPTITCPANKVADANGDCEATINLGNPTVSGGQNVTVSVTRSDGKPMYDCDTNGENCVRKSQDLPFAAGVTVVTWTATSHDAQGNDAGNASCTQTVTVNDVNPPVITATNETVSANSSCQAVIPDYTNSVADNCACASSDTSENCVGHPHIAVTQSPVAGTVVGPGAHSVQITANDGSSNNDGAGNTTEKTITFTVNDTTAPTVTAPADSSATADADCQAAVPDYAANSTASDNCDTSLTLTQSPAAGTMVGKGQHTVTVTTTDDAGNVGSDTVVFTVNDTTAPVISCPANITTGTDPDTCSATVNPGAATATDNCDSSPTVTGTRSDGQPLNALYPKGTTTITWTATDDDGNSSSCTQTVTVNDTQGPTITVVAQTSMWPPNHKYKTFTVANLVTGVTDNCEGTIGISNVVITKVTSDELENSGGDGNTLNDIVIAANCQSVQLRAEREGGGNGRVYTIFFSVTDSLGNIGTATAKVVVPHNNGSTAVDSGPHYTVTSNCP